MAEDITPKRIHVLKFKDDDTEYTIPQSLTDLSDYSNFQNVETALFNDNQGIYKYFRSSDKTPQQLHAQGKTLTSNDTINTILDNGFYNFEVSGTNPTAGGTFPTDISQYVLGSLLAIQRNGDPKRCTQIFFGINGDMAIRIISDKNGTMTIPAWRYINPKYSSGVEYLTTESLGGESVYKKYISSSKKMQSKIGSDGDWQDELSWTTVPKKIHTTNPETLSGSPFSSETIFEQALFKMDPNDKTKYTGLLNDIPVNESRTYLVGINSIGGVSTANWTWRMTLLKTSDSTNATTKEKTVYAMVTLESGFGGCLCKINKVLSNNTWKAAEWENPPLISGVKYGTNERRNGSQVYKKYQDGKFYFTITPTNDASWVEEADWIKAARAEYTIQPTQINSSSTAKTWAQFESWGLSNDVLGSMNSGETRNYCGYLSDIGTTNPEKPGNWLWKINITKTSGTDANSYYAFLTLESGYKGYSKFHCSYQGNGKLSEPQWENPPLTLNREYCTTERWDGYPVYRKIVSKSIDLRSPNKVAGAGSDALGYKTETIAHGITNFSRIISCDATSHADKYLLPYVKTDGTTSLDVHLVDATNIQLRIYEDSFPTRVWYFDLKYIKS